ncbi:MAG: hypothetical protein AAB480_01200 [Patescibacteria group bacterium]
MKRNANGRTSAFVLVAVALSLGTGATLFVGEASRLSGFDGLQLVAQAAASAEPSSTITKDVLKHPCESGYLYEILTAPAGSKEPFSIKKSPNPNDPEKRWSGVVKFRKPARTAGGKATITTMSCSGGAAASMLTLMKETSSYGGGVALSYTDFAVNTPLDPRNTDQLTSAFTPPANNTNTAVAPAGNLDKTPPVVGEMPAGATAPPANRELYEENNQGTIAPPAKNSSGRTSSECPTCGVELRSSPSSPAAPPAGSPTPEYITNLNNRVSSVATAALEKHPDVAAFGGADVVKACVAAQNCDEVVPKTKGIESFFKTENDANEKYSKIVSDTTYAAIKAQPGLGSVDRPNQEIARALSMINLESGSSWRGGSNENWGRTTFNLNDADNPAFMWTDKMQATNRTPSDIVVYKGDGSSVSVRANGELVNPGGFVSQVEDRITTEKTYNEFFSAMVGANKSAADKANFTLEDSSLPAGERTVKVVNDTRVQLATLPEKAYGALQGWGDRVYENNFQDEIKKATEGKLSFVPSGAFPKDVNIDFRFAPAGALSPLTPDQRYEKQEALLAAVQRYTPEYWANLREPAILADFGTIPGNAQVKAGAYTGLGTGNMRMWINGNYPTDWLNASFDHETLHLVEGPSGSRFYPSDREWGTTMFGEQYGRVYTAESGVDSMAAGGTTGSSDCSQFNRPEGFPTCYAYKGGPTEHKADMQKFVMGNYALAQQEAQRNPTFKKAFDLMVQSLYKASNGTMTVEYLASLPPTLPASELRPVNIPLTMRIDMILRSLGRR